MDLKASDKRQVVRVRDEKGENESDDEEREKEEKKTTDQRNETINGSNIPADSRSAEQAQKETKFFVTLSGVDEAQFAKSSTAKARRGGLFDIDAQDEELIYEGEDGYDDFDMNENQPDQQLVNENFR